MPAGAGAVTGRWSTGRKRAPACRRRAAWVALAAVLTATPVAGQPPSRAPAEPGGSPVPVVVARAVAQAVRDEVSYIGTVEPDRAVTVQAEVAGRVIRAEPREGDPVVEGQTVIAELDRTPNELALQEARASAAKARHEWEKQARGYRPEEIAEARQNMARAQARLRDLEAGARPQEREQARSALEEAEARRTMAEREFRRVEQLIAQQLVAAQERDRALQAFEVARSQERAAREQVALVEAGTRPEQVEAARAEVRQLEQRLKLLEAGPRAEDVAQAEAEFRRVSYTIERLEDELRRMRVIAPFTGFLVRKRVESGAWVKAGDPVADLIDLDPVFVTGPVSELEVRRLRIGGRARVALDAYPGRVFSGEVSAIVPLADPQTRTFPVKVRVANLDHVLKSGMFARVALEIPGGRSAIHVPREAVVRREGSTVVFVVEDGVARAVSVRTGPASAPGLAEVVEGRLAAGQEVVVSGGDALRDGARVRKVTAAPGGGPAPSGAPPSGKGQAPR